MCRKSKYIFLYTRGKLEKLKSGKFAGEKIELAQKIRQISYGQFP